jgi:hypothetical protein
MLLNLAIFDVISKISPLNNHSKNGTLAKVKNQAGLKAKNRHQEVSEPLIHSNKRVDQHQLVVQHNSLRCMMPYTGIY